MRNEGDNTSRGIDVKNDLGDNAIVCCDDCVLFSCLLGSCFHSFDGLVGHSWDYLCGCAQDSLELFSQSDGFRVGCENIHLSQLVYFLDCP